MRVAAGTFCPQRLSIISRLMSPFLPARTLGCDSQPAHADWGPGHDRLHALANLYLYCHQRHLHPMPKATQLDLPIHAHTCQ